MQSCKEAGGAPNLAKRGAARQANVAPLTEVGDAAAETSWDPGSPVAVAHRGQSHLFSI